METSYSKGFRVGCKVAAGPEFAKEGDGCGVKVDIDQRADYFLYNHVELIIKQALSRERELSCAKSKCFPLDEGEVEKGNKNH